jgi:fibronectin type 3 domain-containing protein
MSLTPSGLGRLLVWGALLFARVASAAPAPLDQPPNTWVKRSPLADTPPSPRLGYEGACAWDPVHRLLFRHGGHNQGGGGEQHAETWTFDPATAAWTLRETDTAPPGVCCAQQYLVDPVGNRFLRFPAFSGSHGWQWFREIYLNNASVWAYDLDANRFRSRAPCPEPRVTGLRCASWDSDAQVVVIFGGESCQEGTVVYDPHANEWTRMKLPKQPEFRSGGNMVYDAARKRHILFGSQFSDDPHTWAYDLRKNEWTDLKPEASPPTKENDATLAYDAEHGVVVALVKITQGKDEAAKHRLETWAYAGAHNKWTKMNPPEEPEAGGSRTRVLAWAPELGLTLLENAIQVGKTREQQVWTYRYAERKPDPAAPPPPPRSLRVTTGADSAQLAWEASSTAARVRIYRGTGSTPWQADFEKAAEVDAQTTVWRDEGLKHGVIYYYTLRSVDADGREGADSVKARTQPRLVEDVVVSVLNPSEVEVAWTPLPEKDVAGYYVERAVVEVATDDQLRKLKTKVAPLDPPSAGAVMRVGAFLRITCDPVKGARYPDAVDLAAPKAVEGEPIQARTFHKDDWDAAGKTYPFAVYAYRVRAVNALGVVGGPSPVVHTIPSIPRQVFAKEDGGTCRLKWAANPEQKLKGYRVYRMDGRYDKEPMTRLTSDPVAESAFADEGAGKKTRRYYVVAVDAIGQEGHPSSPVWYEREWKAYYKPFTGEWHQ